VVSAKLRELYGEEVGKGVECVVPDDFSEQSLGQLDLRSRYKASALAVAKDEGRNTFILSTHQINALLMQPGGYKTADYMRVGSGLMVLFLVILMTMLVLFY